MTRSSRYALCTENRGFPAALESGGDYLYPEGFSVPIEVPRKAVRVFLSKSA